MICLLLIDDGREDYLERCRDSLDPVRTEFRTSVLVEDPDHELGFCGAIERGWERALDTDCDLIFHVESDFVFPEPPPIDRMATIAAENPDLAQVALKRQPWNEREKAAGGIVEADPDDFEEITLDSETITVHRRFFTTNPSIYRREIAARGWPQVEHSEGIFTHQLLDDGFRFALWGGKSDPPAVTHIGRVRTGVGY